MQNNLRPRFARDWGLETSSSECTQLTRTARTGSGSDLCNNRSEVREQRLGELGWAEITCCHTAVRTEATSSAGRLAPICCFWCLKLAQTPVSPDGQRSRELTSETPILSFVSRANENHVGSNVVFVFLSFSPKISLRRGVVPRAQNPVLAETWDASLKNISTSYRKKWETWFSLIRIPSFFSRLLYFFPLDMATKTIKGHV